MSVQLSYRVAIIGAGPSGLTLARLLHLSSIPCTVFEPESSSDSRAQGSTLDLHDSTGLEAIDACGLREQFEKYARYDGEAMIICNKNFKSYIQEKGARNREESHGSSEIDRSKLREILLASVPSDTIRWGCKLESVGEDGTLHFEHGTESGFGLVVGADGAWSKIRPVLVDVKPYYAGIGGFCFQISEPERRFPDLYKAVNRGSVFAFDDGKGVMPQQLGDGSLNLYGFFRRDEDWMDKCGYDPSKDVEAVRKDIGEMLEGWNPTLKKYPLVADEDSLVPRNLYMLPDGHKWVHRRGFTLIGDAAHLMTPFAGAGANAAMKDALNSGRAITKAIAIGNTETVDENVKISEEEMFERAGRISWETERNMKGFFSLDSWHFEKLLINTASEMALHAVTSSLMRSIRWISGQRTVLFDN